MLKLSKIVWLRKSTEHLTFCESVDWQEITRVKIAIRPFVGLIYFSRSVLDPLNNSSVRAVVFEPFLLPAIFANIRSSRCNGSYVTICNSRILADGLLRDFCRFKLSGKSLPV